MKPKRYVLVDADELEALKRAISKAQVGGTNYMNERWIEKLLKDMNQLPADDLMEAAKEVLARHGKDPHFFSTLGVLKRALKDIGALEGE